MKKSYILIIILFSSLIISTSAFAQDQSFDEKIKEMAGDNLTLYLQPFVTGFGTAMNSGVFHTAGIHSIAGFDITANLMVAAIPDDDKRYIPVFPDAVDIPGLGSIPFDEVYGEGPFEAQTFAGSSDLDSALTITGQGPYSAAPDLYLPPGTGFSLVAFAVPQVSVGLIMGTEVTLRYLPAFEVSDDIGEIELIGFGFSHDLAQYIPVPLPLFPKLAVGAMFQTLTVGDLIESNHTAFNIRVSKSAVLFSAFLGAQFETSDLTATYEYTDPFTNNPEELVVELDGDNSMRFTGGVAIAVFPFMTAFVHGSSGTYMSVNTGLRFSFR